MRYAIRTLLKSPGFTAVAIVTLALGIGANTAIFSVANAVLLRPLPYPAADRLALISAMKKQTGNERGPLSWPRVSLMQERNRSFSGLAAMTHESFTLTGRGDPEQLTGARVTWNFFQVMGVPPMLGRPFAANEDDPGSDRVVILTHALWRRRFAEDRSVVGQHLTLDGKDYTVAGVLPPDARFEFVATGVELFSTRVYELNLVTPEAVRRGVGFLQAVGRLRPEATLASTQSEMDVLAAQYRAEYPKAPDSDPGMSVHIGNLRDETVVNIRATLLILAGSVAVVLLIACANLASLQLSRALGRRREVAVRTAIGASRGTVVRQLLTESVVLALAGGIGGIVLSAVGVRLMAPMVHEYLPRAAEIRTDGWVLVFALAVSGLAGVLFGLAPALQISRPDLNSVLRTEGRGSTAGRRRNRLRSGLVMAQVALSLVLLIGASLLLRNFLQMREASPGFQARNLLTMHIALPPARYGTARQVVAFYEEALRKVRALPGVESAAVASALPAHRVRISPALAEGQPVVPIAERPLFLIFMCSPGYERTMQLRVLAGRSFTEHDDSTAPDVLMVNETTVRRYWPHENPIGKHIIVGGLKQPMEVVGVLADIPNAALNADAEPEIYMPLAQRPWAWMNLIVRTSGDPHQYASAVRGGVQAVDRDQPVTGVRTMEEVLEGAASQPRITAALLGSLAALAMVLAMVGIYGAIAYAVAERTSELGIRIALGAERADILRMVLRQGLTPAVAGIAAGLAGALALTRLLSGLLYRVSVTDPAAFIVGPLVFLAVAVAASYVPARRATKVDPMVALRYQ